MVTERHTEQINIGEKRPTNSQPLQKLPHKYNLRPRVNAIGYNYDWLKFTIIVVMMQSHYNKRLPLNGFQPNSFVHLSSQIINEPEQQEIQDESSSLSEQEYNEEPRQWGEDKDRPVASRYRIWNSGTMNEDVHP